MKVVTTKGLHRALAEYQKVLYVNDEWASALSARDGNHTGLDDLLASCFQGSRCDRDNDTEALPVLRPDLRVLWGIQTAKFAGEHKDTIADMLSQGSTDRASLPARLGRSLTVALPTLHTRFFR